MFSSIHIWYIVISALITVGALVGLGFIKNDKYKNLAMLIIAIVTFLLHISIVVVDSVNAGQLLIDWELLVPVHFCNLSRYLLFLIPIIKKKESWVFQCVACLLAYGGTIGCLSTVIYADSLVTDPLMQDWATWKSLLSHSVMMIGCLYLFVGKFIRVRVFNVVYLFIAGVATGILGLIINGIYLLCGAANPNSMYWAEPLADIPGFIAPTVLVVCCLLVFAITAIYEQIKVPKGERWYNKLKRKK